MNVYARKKTVSIQLGERENYFALCRGLKFEGKDVWINIFQGFRFNKYVTAFTFNPDSNLKFENFGAVKFTVGTVTNSGEIIASCVLCTY